MSTTISPLSLNEPLAGLSAAPPTRAGEESSRSPFVSSVEEILSTSGTRYSGARPVSEILPHPRTPTASLQRISQAPRPDPLRSNPISPRFPGAQSVVERRPIATRASLPPLKTHNWDGIFPAHSNEDDSSAPAPSVPIAPARSESPRRRDGGTLQKPSPDSCHAAFPKTDTSRPPLTQTEVVSKEDGSECVVITLQPRAAKSGQNKSARRSRLVDRSDKRSSCYLERRSNSSPVKDDGSSVSSPSPVTSATSSKHSGVIEIAYMPACGQRLSQFDIVANQIENALNRLR